MIRHRAVALADLSSLAFFGGFGALVLGGVLLLTGLWHESVLRAGFMIAPGPLLAGLTAFPGGLLGARFGHRAVGTVGALLFAAGGLWWITHVTAVPDWSGDYLPGSLLSGIGVGLMLPSLGGAATAPLPPERFATGSALYVMTRQIGIALGVAGLVAILGTATGASAVTAFHHAWIFMIACSLVAGALLQGVGNRVTEVADASVEAEPHDATGRTAPVPRPARSTRSPPASRRDSPPATGHGPTRRAPAQSLPLGVEPARPQRGGQGGIVGEAEPGQARRVRVGEGGAEAELTLGDRQRVARHARLEAGAALAAFHHLVEVLAHRLDQLGRGGSPEGRRRFRPPRGFRRSAGGGVPRRPKRSHSLSQTRRPMVASSTERGPRSGGPRPAARRWWPT